MSRTDPQVHDYMTGNVYSIGADQKFSYALQVMRLHHVRHLPVLQGGKLVGIISERDVYWMETLKDADTEDMLVEEGMTPLPYTVAPDAPLAQVAREMAERKYGAAVVMTGADVVGIFTTIDALRALAEALTTAPPAPTKAAPKKAAPTKAAPKKAAPKKAAPKKAAPKKAAPKKAVPKRAPPKKPAKKASSKKPAARR